MSARSRMSARSMRTGPPPQRPVDVTASALLRNPLPADAPRPKIGPSHLPVQAQEYFPMYNDRPEVDDGAAYGAGLSKNDTRAKAGERAAWGDPVVAVRQVWEQKYTGPDLAGRNPTAWEETRSGLDSTTRDALLAQKEKGGSRASPQSSTRSGGGGSRAPSVVSFSSSSVAAANTKAVRSDFNTPSRSAAEFEAGESAYSKLQRETYAKLHEGTLSSQPHPLRGTPPGYAGRLGYRATADGSVGLSPWRPPSQRDDHLNHPHLAPEFQLNSPENEEAERQAAEDAANRAAAKAMAARAKSSVAKAEAAVALARLEADAATRRKGEAAKALAHAEAKVRSLRPNIVRA